MFYVNSLAVFKFAYPEYVYFEIRQSSFVLLLQLKKQPPLEKHSSDLESPSIYDIEQILCRLLTTTSMMTKFLKQVSQHSSFKKFKQQRKLKKMKSKGEQEPEDMPSKDMQM